MHIAVHPAHNKDDDEDEDGKDDDDDEEEEEQEQDVVASNTSPQGHAFKRQLINIAESENKITRRGSFKAKQSQICCFVYQHHLWWARLNPHTFPVH